MKAIFGILRAAAVTAALISVQGCEGDSPPASKPAVDAGPSASAKAEQKSALADDDQLREALRDRARSEITKANAADEASKLEQALEAELRELE